MAAARSASTFLFLFCCQFGLTQYGTYIAFSWDIIEPITCTMTLMDATLAYLFWMWTGQPYDMEGLRTHYFHRKLKKLMRRQNVDYSYYE